MRLAVDVAGFVLGRPPDLEELLLEVAALARVHDDRVLVDAITDEGLDSLVPQHFREHGAVGGAQDEEPVLLGEGEAAVARHRVRDVDEQGVRHGVAAVRHQRIDDLLRVVSGRAGVPQTERSDAIGVDVLRRSLQLGERCNGAPCLGRLGVVDLEQEGLVALNNQCAVSHATSVGVVGIGAVAAVVHVAGNAEREECNRPDDEQDCAHAEDDPADLRQAARALGVRGVLGQRDDAEGQRRRSRKQQENTAMADTIVRTRALVFCGAGAP